MGTSTDLSRVQIGGVMFWFLWEGKVNCSEVKKEFVGCCEGTAQLCLSALACPAIAGLVYVRYSRSNMLDHVLVVFRSMNLPPPTITQHSIALACIIIISVVLFT